MRAVAQLKDFIHTFNSLVVPGGNLGISRSQMPQVDSQYLQQFLKYLNDNGIATDQTSVPANQLRLAQTEYNKHKVLKLMDLYRNSPKEKQKPIIVSRDGFVMDGSHRFLAQYNANPTAPVKVIKADSDIRPLLAIARKAGGVSFRSVSDTKLSK